MIFERIVLTQDDMLERFYRLNRCNDRTKMESVAEVPEEEYGGDGYEPALRRARSRSYYKPRCSIVFHLAASG
jgi:hypothetical protein